VSNASESAEPVSLIALDPGKNVGVAFVSRSGTLLFHEVLELEQLTELEFPPEATLLVGNGTGTQDVQVVLKGLGLAYNVVDEWGTSLAARKLYFRDHPPKGFGRLVPEGMRSPPELIDDYAAYALALEYLESTAKSR
jgi:hypothetical protein